MNAFVDARTTRTGESSLIIAINNRDEKLILFMLNEIWNANGSGSNSALIFDRILHSKFGDDGKRILDALSTWKLYATMTCLMGHNPY